MAIDKELVALLVPGRKATPTEEKPVESVAETPEPTTKNDAPIVPENPFGGTKTDGIRSILKENPFRASRA